MRVRVSRGERALTTVMLVSSGAESEEPTVVLRPEAAEELGLSLESFDIVEVELASRGPAASYPRTGSGSTSWTRGVVLPGTSAYLVVNESLTEPLITDATMDELGIVVLSFKRGLWRHASDPPEVVRRSAAPS